MSLPDEVLDAASDLVGHFGAGRVNEYFKCFSPEADFIFYTHSERLATLATYKKLWAQWEKEMGLKVVSCTSSDQHVQMLGPESAVFTHNVSTTLQNNEGQESVLERETIVFKLLSGKWLAVHEHLSSRSG